MLFIKLLQRLALASQWHWSMLGYGAFYSISAISNC